ncbi:MAG: hypothetical protein AAF376_09410 [Pseudomonadota bacterium]
MSIWTSRAALALAYLTVLAGCVPLGGAPPLPPDVRVTRDAIAVPGPSGFCADPTATQDAGDTAFVILGNCAAILNARRAAQPSVPAVLTATISEPGNGGQISANLSSLDSYFRSADGRRLLSRAQDADSVSILDSRVEGDAFFIRASDTSAGPVAGVQAEYWRAYMDLNDRIVTLSVLGLEGQSLNAADGLQTLRRFSQRVRTANEASPAAQPTVQADVRPPPQTAPRPRPVAPAPAPAPVEQEPLIEDVPLQNVGFLRRIMG